MKVRSVRQTGKFVPVYDLEVPALHNFILRCGVVVHNCRYGTEHIWKRRGQ